MKLSKRKPEEVRRFLLLSLALGLGMMALWMLLFVEWGASSSSSKEAPPVSSPAQSAAPPSPVGEQKQEQESSRSMTADDIQSAQKRARQFLRVYAALDGKDPMAYLEASRPYMTEAFYEREKKGIRRPTYEVQEQRVIDIQRTDHLPQEDGIQWGMQTILEVTNAKGKTHREEVVFLLQLVKEHGEWKVREVERLGSAG